MNWQKIVLPKYEIDLSTILRSGQAFRWRNLNNVWSCALNNQIILIKESVDKMNESTQIIEYLNINNDKEDNTSKDITQFLNDYFNLSTSTRELHLHWSKVDSYFPQFNNDDGVKTKTEDLLITPPASERQSPEISTMIPKGVRILSQDPWETLISFIISSNNNIKRISQLCEILCISYGKSIGTFSNIPYFTFPKPVEFFSLKENEKPTSLQLNKLESELRALGFGYRAKYITKTVNKMIEEPELYQKLINSKTTWNGENTKDDELCVEFLREFDGVGPKVADCVALMGCHRHDLVPIDTHVWNILRSRYRDQFNNWVDLLSDDLLTIPKSTLKKSLSNKSVDVKIYPFVKQFFKDYWGIKSGWAQAVVFAGMVKLDNGINSVEDVEKLIDKVNNTKATILEDNNDDIGQTRKVKRRKTK